MLNSIDYRNDQYIDNQGKAYLKHNRSTCHQQFKLGSNPPNNTSVHGHHTSTSSATKRRKSAYLKSKSLLTDSKIE